MKISSRLDYAMSFILRVADKYEAKTPISAECVAQKEKVNSDYVEQLLGIMKRRGLLKSVRGPGGGYLLADSPDKISAKNVVESIENTILEPVCFRKKGRRRRCAHLDECKLVGFWLGLGEAMGLYLKEHSLKKLVTLRRKESVW